MPDQPPAARAVPGIDAAQAGRQRDRARRHPGARRGAARQVQRLRQTDQVGKSGHEADQPDPQHRAAQAVDHRLGPQAQALGQLGQVGREGRLGAQRQPPVAPGRQIGAGRAGQRQQLRAQRLGLDRLGLEMHRQRTQRRHQIDHAGQLRRAHPRRQPRHLLGQRRIEAAAELERPGGVAQRQQPHPVLLGCHAGSSGLTARASGPARSGNGCACPWPAQWPSRSRPVRGGWRPDRSPPRPPRC